MTKRNLLETFKQFDKKYSINLKEHVPKKYFNNKIIYGGVVAVLFLAIYALYVSGSITSHGINVSNRIYYFCPEESLMPCVVNATINKEGIETEATIFLQPGETFGEVPPSIVKSFDFYVLLIMVSAFLLNHLYFKWSHRHG